MLKGRLNIYRQTSLMVPRLRIHLPVQGTRGRSLVREYPTCLGATKPRQNNYGAQVPQPLRPTRHSDESPSPCLQPESPHSSKGQEQPELKASCRGVYLYKIQIKCLYLDCIRVSQIITTQFKSEQ
ncbi:unnamed protein product [Rangifer tarandus platyrhynchus]|uniref:Uncharacterized protein n=2 Tax=Rangifer tarandus platyrhynchus TaxID=3082113 RepID=A0AC60A5N5_RANTA|nr:unnamed protein product [Rangifer tarandus platyrhynchus]